MDASDHGLPGSAETAGLAPRGARLDRALARTSDAPLREGNRLELLKNGPHTYDDWVAAIASARRWVHLDNYIFQNDDTGQRFAGALAEKASAKVRVRVLYDWFGCMDVPRSFWRGFRDAGVEVRAVNPPTLGAPLGAIRRDHRKLLAVDGEYASTGGVCISDGWLVRSPETGLPYRDTAVSVLGPAVADVERAFAGVWDETGKPLPAEERPRAEDIPAAGEEPVRVVVQEPQRMHARARPRCGDQRHPAWGFPPQSPLPPAPRLAAGAHRRPLRGARSGARRAVGEGKPPGCLTAPPIRRRCSRRLAWRGIGPRRRLG
jgi:cardiolipin synthase A/B